MRAALLAVIGVASAACVLAQAAPPQFSNQLYVKGVMNLPYAGIVEPFESWYNVDKMRVDYYGGLDRYVFRGDLNVTWQVNPEILEKQCFETAGAPDIRPYVPDTTGFVLQQDAVEINDQECDDWQLSVTTMNKTSVYDLYMSRSTGAVVRYKMMGYDSLIGSHFDLYFIDYENVTAGAIDDSIFAQPPMTCGSFPGPGATAFNPLDESEGFFPGGELEDGQVVSAAYADYLEAHGKEYGTVEELRQREAHFMKHRAFVAHHQRRYRVGKETYSVALNFLADHTPAELAARRGRLSTPKGGRKPNNAAGYHQRNYYDADLPTEIDWRQKGAVTPPQDQGICGSCWSFGSTGAIEGAYFVKYGSLHVFAEQELMDCSWNQGNNACDGGEDFRAYDWVMQNGGMSFKENYGPYLMQDSYCLASQKSPDASIQSYINVTQFDENALMDALASVGPVSISIDASHPGLSFYTGGVYYDPACKSDLNDLDHSVLAVGYGTDADGGDYWIVKNSWSTYWGVDGFIKMSRKNNNCGVASQPTYVVLN